MKTLAQGRAGARTAFGRRLRAALLAALLLIVALPQAAAAHGALRRSKPAEGAQLTVVPRELRLVFNETVELGFARLALTGPDGPVALGALAHAPDSASLLVAAVTGGLIAGPYTLAWQIAGEDGHPVRGQIAFTI
ncbi:MAG TPA: copper resistance CopC family protein, partial [Longimicrobium sp.]|nr:copper resistance CopC family protein [Longimicrobium sp.]